MRSIRFLSVFLVVISFSFSSFVADGFLDTRYVWSKEQASGTGTFQVKNFNLDCNFPLNRAYKVFLQTNIFPAINNSQIIKQIYLDTDTFLPMQLRIGRFKVETMERDKNQAESCFISNPIFWDIYWQKAGNPLLPDNETGISVYNSGINHDFYLYLVNGSNEWEESVKNSKKSVGVYLKTYFKNIVELRTSIYSNLYDNENSDHTVFTGEASMLILDMKIKSGILLLLGKKNGINDNAFGGIFEVVIPVEDSLDLAGFASLYKNGQFFYRGVLSLRMTVNQDIVWKNEFSIEKDNTNLFRDYKFQSQIVVLL